ncbi:MAG: hypothetical protein QXI27_04745 [Nitrososphaerota archaeon]
MKEDRQGFKDSKVALSLEPDGWVLRLLSDGGSAVIFADILSLEANQRIAAQLSIPLDEAWKLKREALDQWWPKDLDEVRRLFPRIVGEDDNVKLLILSLFSLKLREPSERLMGVIIEASNSAGKSHIAREILKPLQELKAVLEFTRMTGAFLERRFQGQNLDRKILFFQEAHHAPAQLHLALSEGKLHIGLVERVDGHFEPIEITCEGQPFLILTSPSWSGSQDLVHRCVVINLDESPQQTKRIIEFQSRLNSDLMFRDAFEKFAAGCEKMFRRIWEDAPENVKVVIPFLHLIAGKLEQVESLDVKLRRDFNKLIALIKASAILFHKNRPVLVKEENGLKDIIIVASLEDLENVLPLVDSNMRQILASISGKEKLVLEIMRESDMEFFTYSELSRLTGVPSSSLRQVIIPRLEAKGYVIVDRESRSHRIELTKKDYSVPDLRVDPAEAERLIKDCLASLSSLGYAHCYCYNNERSPETASNCQKEPGELAAVETAKDSGSFSENPESGSESENKPAELAVSTAANDLDSFSENKRDSGSFPNLSNSKEHVGDEWMAVAIPLEVEGRRVGRILLRTLDLDIELNVGPLFQEVEELLGDLKALYGEETVSASADGRVIRICRNISGGEIALLASRIREKLASAIKETALTASGNAGKPSPRIITTTMKMLCEDCYLQLKRAGAIHRECGRPGALEVCHECRRALADHVVFIKIGEGGGTP